MALQAVVGEQVTLVVYLDDGNDAMYPQAEVYATGSDTPTTLDMSHVATGRYEALWTPVATGYYTAIVIVYEDAGHTTASAIYPSGAEQAYVIEEGWGEAADEMEAAGT
jgi:hypothetical protein